MNTDKVALTCAPSSSGKECCQSVNKRSRLCRNGVALQAAVKLSKDFCWRLFELQFTIETGRTTDRKTRQIALSKIANQLLSCRHFNTVRRAKISMGYWPETCNLISCTSWQTRHHWAGNPWLPHLGPPHTNTNTQTQKHTHTHTCPRHDLIGRLLLFVMNRVCTIQPQGTPVLPTHSNTNTHTNAC